MTIVSCLVGIGIEIFKSMPSKMRESERSAKRHEWLIVVWKCLSHIADSSGLVQLAEAVINAPLSVIAMWKRGGRKSYCDFAAAFPMAKSSCCCVFFRGDLHCSFKLWSKDEVCPPTDHISEWFYGLAIASDWTGAWEEFRSDASDVQAAPLRR
jgi:hypothetical protein